MPTEREREYYRDGYSDGFRDGSSDPHGTRKGMYTTVERKLSKPKRKLSAWNKFVKANSKKKIYQYASGKLKLKKMGIAFRKKRK